MIPTDWISTGSYALNYPVSGEFDKGIPLGKVTVSQVSLVQVKVIL